MDKQRLEEEVISAIKQLTINVSGEQDSDKTKEVQVAKTDSIASLGIDSLEIVALTEVLEKRFNLGYVDIDCINNMTVGELCQKVVNHNVRIEVKQKLLELLNELDPHTDYSSAHEDERIFWDLGLDALDVENLVCKIELRFDVDLSDYNLSDYTLGEVIDCIAKHV